MERTSHGNTTVLAYIAPVLNQLQNIYITINHIHNKCLRDMSVLCICIYKYTHACIYLRREKIIC